MSLVAEGSSNGGQSNNKIHTERIVNRHGSCAGASSSEFDNYRNERNRERERVAAMEEEYKKRRESEELSAKVQRNREEAELRTKKNAEKRKLKKEKRKLNKLKGKDSKADDIDSDKEDDEPSNEGETSTLSESQNFDNLEQFSKKQCIDANEATNLTLQP